MVKICQMGLLKLNFEIIPKNAFSGFCQKISAGQGWSWKFFFATLQILGPLGCQGWVVIPQNVKKSKSLHPNIQVVVPACYRLFRLSGRCDIPMPLSTYSPVRDYEFGCWLFLLGFCQFRKYIYRTVNVLWACATYIREELLYCSSLNVFFHSSG
jgi:hypothetical protein